jgi:tetratricopeptide (TPR) repeat protein
VALLLCGIPVAASCTSSGPAGSPGGNANAAACLSRPELSRASEPVRAQVRERHALLTQKVQAATPPGNLATEYGEMGKLLMAAEYRQAAEPCLLNAQSLAPADVRWPYYLAHLYRLEGDPAKTILAFERVLELRPDDVAALTWLGDIHLLQGQPGPAAPLFTKALTLQPGVAGAVFGLGRAALAEGDYAGAAGHMEQALALDPLASAVHYPLALAYRGLGQTDKAEAHLRQRGQVEPARPDPLMAELQESLHSAVGYERLGEQAMAKKEWATALGYFRKGVEIAPDNSSVRHKLGTALYVSGDAAGAREQFEEVVRRSPDFAKGRYSLGVLMLSSGRLEDAVTQLAAAVKSEPADVEARLRLGEALRRSGRPEEALPHYEHAAGIDPQLAEPKYGTAITLVRLRRYQDARDWLKDGMQAYPAQPLFARALARLLASAPDDRVRDGRQALTLAERLLKERQTLDVGETMAMALAEVGRYEQAAVFQREVMAAAAKAGLSATVTRLGDTLKLYERRQPCRTPLAPDDPLEVFEAAS